MIAFWWLVDAPGYASPGVSGGKIDISKPGEIAKCTERTSQGFLKYPKVENP
jgi:hypothetical protein